MGKSVLPGLLACKASPKRKKEPEKRKKRTPLDPPIVQIVPERSIGVFLTMSETAITRYIVACQRLVSSSLDQPWTPIPAPECVYG